MKVLLKRWRGDSWENEMRLTVGFQRCTRKLVLVSCTVLFCTAAAAVDLESPTGGWRNSEQDDRLSEVRAAYPKPPVDRGGQRHRTLIKGHIEKAGKDRRPYQFIVNGNAMPLYTDEQGLFIKLWAFGPGSNSVEIRSPDGQQRKRLQFYEAHTSKTQAKIRIILGWDDAKAEVDLHVITPDGQHAFWARPVLRNGGGLDVDSVDGGGPEIFSMASPLKGTYLIYVNYWGNFDPAGYHFDETRREKPVITTMVTIITNENTVHEKRETYVTPLRKIGDLTFVKALRN
jgi:uncharacterized protein YfaP (DUF2135 family)